MMQKLNNVQMYFLTFKLTTQALKFNIKSMIIYHMFLNELKFKLIAE